MTTWKRGRDLLFARIRQDSLPLKSFLARLPQIAAPSACPASPCS